jgi:ribonuclease R
LQGVLTQIVERRGGAVIGVLLGDDRGATVEPFEPSAAERLDVARPLPRGARVGDAVRVERVGNRTRDGRGSSRVVEVLGRLGEPGVDTLVVTRKYELATEFPDDVATRAEALPKRVGPTEKRRRVRFDSPPPVTIDGESARDFDDAIAVRSLGELGFRLFVHIADVAHFVRPGGALDLEARRRGTSVYFPETVLPMLPEELSNGLCSLRPGVDRLVQTAVLDIGPDGELRRARFDDGVIRSAARLTYTQVGGLLDGEHGHGVPRRVVPMLGVADKLRRALEGKRKRRGSVDFDLPEPRILLDVEGAMTGVTVEPRNKAHRLIEECMLAANEAVALHLESRGAPCMYRIHDEPDPVKLETLVTFARGLGITVTGIGGQDNHHRVQAVLEAAEGRPEAPVIHQLALRTMQQARYSMENHGHFGLAAPTYCHFTSPIRRYPDLIVHRLLRECRAGRESSPSHDSGEMDSIAETSSQLERNAEAAERELLSWKKVAFMQERIGESFEGLVVGVARFGLFVRLGEGLAEGLLRSEQLGPGPFVFSEARQRLRSVASGRSFKLGDRIEVVVQRVEPHLRRIDLAPHRKPTRRHDEKGGTSPRTPPSAAEIDRRAGPSPAGRTAAARAQIGQDGG